MSMTERHGAFTIPTLLFLSPEHRVRLERLVRAQEIDLAELVSRIVADYLDGLPELPDIPAEPHEPDQATRLHQRRAELARLRAQHASAGPQPPAWLGAYIAELEADLRRLEG
jgi:hypothetical protein